MFNLQHESTLELETKITDFYNIWIKYDMDPPKIRVIQYYYFDV